MYEPKLDDNAELYKKREYKTEREKLREMTLKEKLGYLWEYYRIHAAIVVIVIIIISYVLHGILSPKIETKFYAAFVDNIVPIDTLDQYQAEFSDYLKLNPQKAKVNFNNNFYLSSDSSYSMNMKQALSTYIYAKEIDVIIAPESEFKNFAYYGFLSPLTDELPTDLYSNLTDHFYLSDQDKNTEKQVFGIYLNDTELYKGAKEPYLLGIVANARHKENAAMFLRFLYKLKP
jgi:hypothetical protein